jgi:hypothetical protein
MHIFKNVATIVWEHLMGIKTHWRFIWIAVLREDAEYRVGGAQKWTSDITEGVVDLDQN